MKTNRALSMQSLVAAAALAFALPAFADDDWFLKEMSRTDGNANGEHYRPDPGAALAPVRTAADETFLVDMQRAEGFVYPVAQAAPATGKIAER
jgi:hypothetical protein